MQLDILKNNMESKYDKKFEEFKQDLYLKHEKIRILELEIHYLKSKLNDKVLIDYEKLNYLIFDLFFI